MESSSPEFVTSEFDQKPLDYINGGNNSFKFDDFLNFPKEEEVVAADAFFDGTTGISGESSSLTFVDSCDSSVSGGYGQFNGNLSCRSFTDIQFTGSELYVPCDTLDDLEWLSNFVEESFSSNDLQNLHIISPAQNGKAPSTTSAAVTATTDTSSSATTNTLTITDIKNPSLILPTDVSLPGKARSKRSRAAPCDWTSRLLLLSRRSSETNGNNNNTQIKAPKTTAPSRKREPDENPGRRCLHCASETTPQWRTGPMGPKTLCNACGVRYKSGRLVPEYRPAASPTFISAKHSNSHRKVVELRRQKELQMQQQQQQQHQASVFGTSNGGDDFYNHHLHNPCRQQNFTPNYRLLI